METGTEQSPAAKRDVLFQGLVAFGQGTGCLRVSRRAIRTFVNHYRPMIDRGPAVEVWEQEAREALERLRAIGRLAASRASTAGRITVDRQDVREAIDTVEDVSQTILCRPPNGDGS